MTAIYSAIPRSDAVKLIKEHLNYTPKMEMVSLEDAIFRVAAEDIVSRINLPSVKSSRWDGIVFNYENYINCQKNVKGWTLGKDYAFSNTGIGIFEDSFDTMVKIEETEFEDGKLIRIKQENVMEGQQVIPVGERMAVGDILVKKDTKIMPSQLNLLACGGVVNVPVFQPPKVAIIPTGNELVPYNGIIGPGMTVESNSFSMAAKVKASGGIPVVFPIQSDDMEALKKALKSAASVSDIVVIGGGSGRGRYDLLQKTIEEIGTLYFSDVEHGPGKRTCFSVISQTPVIGLVGPPGGEEITFDFYVLPAVEACLNQKHIIRRVNAILDEDIPPHDRVSFYYTLKVTLKDGQYHATVLPHANIDRSIAEHNGYIFVKKTSQGYKKGDIAEVELRVFYEKLIFNQGFIG